MSLLRKLIALFMSHNLILRTKISAAPFTACFSSFHTADLNALPEDSGEATIFLSLANRSARNPCGDCFSAFASSRLPPKDFCADEEEEEEDGEGEDFFGGVEDDCEWLAGD